MEIRAFLKTPKVLTKAGQWKCGALDTKQRMSKTAFPLARKRSFILGNQWWWKLDHYQCGAISGRILIAFHLEKANYIAYLAVERGPEELAIVVCLEHHFDHGSWHWHTKCAELSDFATGATRQRPGGIRIPPKGGYNRVRAYEMGHIEAVNRAYKAFRVADGAASGEQGLLL
ncbi:hypothetical protein [Allosphingosinicella vermicomposti]|uniref:hypothetical protein n=1 Tax=Allosphingosinicella vermicomposti TaxID=614671 RepID=UPI000D0F1AE9|nr:hypothetical protein [Allosphingosinicella vermicomposti]